MAYWLSSSDPFLRCNQIIDWTKHLNERPHSSWDAVASKSWRQIEYHISILHCPFLSLELRKASLIFRSLITTQPIVHVQLSASASVCEDFPLDTVCWCVPPRPHHIGGWWTQVAVTVYKPILTVYSWRMRQIKMPWWPNNSNYPTSDQTGAAPLIVGGLRPGEIR